MWLGRDGANESMKRSTYSIPHIAELRAIAQETKFDRNEWHYRIHRKLSIYLTWCFLHIGFNANQVTLLSFISGLLAPFLIMFAPGYWGLTGYLFFYGYFILDKVDGEVARFRQEESLRGICLDYIGHAIIPALLPLSVGGFLAGTWAIDLFWLLGALAALSVMFVRTARDLPLGIIARKYAKEMAVFTHHLPSSSKISGSNVGNSAKKGKRKPGSLMQPFFLLATFWPSMSIFTATQFVFFTWSSTIWLITGAFLFIILLQIVNMVIFSLQLTLKIESLVEKQLQILVQLVTLSED